jgi:hypothetical protein
MCIPEWQSSIREYVSKEVVNHPYGDLAKSGYKPHMKHRILFIFLYLWLLAGIEYSNQENFLTLFSHV